MSSSSAGTRSSLHAFLWQAGTKIKSPLPITALLSKNGQVQGILPALLSEEALLSLHP